MSQNETKPWERPWTTQEMIENASNWNLAGDSGLLKYLEDFSEKMLTKVKETNNRLDTLIDSADETSLALQNATNKFMGLRNTQFIESRVYDEDETLPIKRETEKEESPKPTEAERLNELKKVISSGLEIVDKYYEKVEIFESDSEDDSNEPEIFYRSIDPYIDRPLPYVIGTDEWHKYWHVGLGHSSSDSEIENEPDQFSESESEHEIMNLPERDRSQIPGISDSESEDLPKNKMSKPVANSTFNDNGNVNRNMFDSNSDSETGSLPPQVNTVNSNFAEELAAKLGKVESSNIQTEVNTRPIKKQPSNIAGGLFSDEPPPLDDDDLFVNKNMNSGLFSGKNGLFDDVNDDNDFWTAKEPPTKPSTISNNDNKPKEEIFPKENNLIASESNIQTAKQSKEPFGLFNEDDDDLFSTASLPQPAKTILAPYKITAPLLSDEPPELEPTVIRKKSIDDASLLSPNTLLSQQIKKNRAPSTSESEPELEPPKVESKKPVESLQEISKVPSIFDNNSPLFSDDIFNTSTNKFSSNLFDPEPEDNFKTPEKNLFADEPPPLTEPVTKKESLFTNDDDDDLFSAKPTKAASKSSGGLFDDTEDSLFSTKKSVSNNESKKAHVSFFDPNPPDLDESDNKSESQSQLSLDNEPMSYGSMNSGRASLFDTEPPLLSNESSGIVKDQSNSRLEGEDYSFYPYLTSSRRHSDLFQDTQSDSLLTARNKLSVGGESNFLSKIPENETMTKIDITPSGNESSLFNEDSSLHNSVFSSVSKSVEKPPVLENDNLFQEQKAPGKQKNKNNSLFQDSDSEDDLFSNKSSGSKNSNTSDGLNNSALKPKKSLKNKYIFQDDSPNFNEIPEKKLESNDNSKVSNEKDNDLEQTKNIRNDNKKFNYEENLKSDVVIKTDPKKSISFEKSLEAEKTEEKDNTDGQILCSSSSPGKLKHNLNINVTALLPGASPPRRQNLEKSASFDSSESNQNVLPIEEVVEPKPIRENTISFDNPIEATEVLSSAVKERVKIPVRRRPSTRRARQEAIRKSAIDLNVEEIISENNSSVNKNISNSEFLPEKSQSILSSENNNRNILVDQKSQESKIKNPLLNPLSPSTDEEDFLIMPQDDLSSDNFKDSLFGKAPVLSPTEDLNKRRTSDDNKKQMNNFFDDMKANEDIFVSSKREISPIEDPNKIKTSDASKKQINNLFDDIKTNEDIFVSSKKEVNKNKTNSSVFSSSDSENDLFNTPKAEQKKPINNLISSPDEDLFKPVTSATNSQKSRLKMLTRDDSLFDDEDIFSTKKIPPKSVIIKKSLFDEDDDNDDDIFGGSSSSGTKTNTQSHNSAVRKVPVAKSRLKKLSADAGQDIDDPLDALKK